MSWQQPVQDRIGQLCAEAHRQANTKPDGTQYKKHRPYPVPPLAEVLMRCLKENDADAAQAILRYLPRQQP